MKHIMKLTIHYGIIICLFALSSPVFAQHSKSEIIDIFKKEILLNDNFKMFVANLDTSDTSGKFVSYGPPGHAVKYLYDTLLQRKLDTLRKKSEDYSKNIFNPALNTAKQIICNKKDRILLRQFFKVIISDTNSADEILSSSLQEIFICQTNLFISEYNESIEQDKPIILHQLCIWFDTIPYQKDNLHPDFNTIKSKLLNTYKQKRTP